MDSPWTHRGAILLHLTGDITTESEDSALLPSPCLTYKSPIRLAILFYGMAPVDRVAPIEVDDE